jgi:two-component system CheB/CheR fusion protein
METPIVFVVSADVAVSDSIKAPVESAGLPAATFRSLQIFLDAVEPARRGCLVLEAHVSDLRDPQWVTAEMTHRR